jgi:hypothetical protein
MWKCGNCGALVPEKFEVCNVCTPSLPPVQEKPSESEGPNTEFMFKHPVHECDIAQIRDRIKFEYQRGFRQGQQSSELVKAAREVNWCLKEWVHEHTAELAEMITDEFVKRSIRAIKDFKTALKKSGAE